MNSFYYGLALLAILLIIHWYIINDGNGQDDGSLGFMATKRPGTADQPQTGENAPSGAGVERPIAAEPCAT